MINYHGSGKKHVIIKRPRWATLEEEEERNFRSKPKKPPSQSA